MCDSVLLEETLGDKGDDKRVSLADNDEEEREEYSVLSRVNSREGFGDRICVD